MWATDAAIQKKKKKAKEKKKKKAKEQKNWFLGMLLCTLGAHL